MVEVSGVGSRLGRVPFIACPLAASPLWMVIVHTLEGVEVLQIMG